MVHASSRVAQWELVEVCGCSSQDLGYSYYGVHFACLAYPSCDGPITELQHHERFRGHPETTNTVQFV